MKKQFSIFALVLIALACSKKDSTTPDSNKNLNLIVASGCLVADVTDSASNKKTEIYTYDASRRLIKIEYPGSAEDGPTTFTYGTGTVSIQEFNTSGVASENPETVPLNANGYYTGGISSEPDTVKGTPGVRKDTVVLTYTSDNRLLSIKYTFTTYANGTNAILNQGRSTTNCTYAGNKLTKIVRSSYYGVDDRDNGSSTTEYTYDEASPTVKSNYEVSEEFNLFGSLQSDKIPVKVVGTYTSAGSSTPGVNTTTYTAVVDAKGNPTKIRTVLTYNGSSPTIRTKIYTYNCP